MKRLLLLAGLILCTSAAHAQGIPYTIVVQAPTGQLKAGATITICSDPPTGTAPCTNPVAAVYSNEALSLTIATPYTTNSLGFFQFWASSGIYWYTVTGAGVTAPQGPFPFSLSNAAALTLPLSIANGGTGASTAAADTLFGNCTGSLAAPSFCALTSGMFPTVAAAGPIQWDSTNEKFVINGDAGSAGTPGYYIGSIAAGAAILEASGLVLNSISGEDVFLGDRSGPKLYDFGLGGALPVGTVRFTSGSAPTSFMFNDGTSSGTTFHGPTFEMDPALVSQSYTWVWPHTMGSAGQVLTSQGTGSVITWSSVPTLGGSNTFTSTNVFSSGLTASPITSNSASPSLTGTIRYASGDTLSWRNNAGSGDLALSKDASDILNWPNAGKFSGAVTPALTGYMAIGYHCGTVVANGACANTANLLPHVVSGIAILSGGASTVGSFTAFTAMSSFFCVANDITTAANTVTAIPISTTSVSFTGTGTDHISFICAGN